MAYDARILCDSVAPNGRRLTTFQLTYPRSIHSELLTHRVLSRNSASSRAIPVEKLMQQITDDPYIPVYWGANQSGMQARKELSASRWSEYAHLMEFGYRASEQELAKHLWLKARDRALEAANNLAVIGLHKQEANRVLEPFMWVTTIVTATEWRNFFALRQDWSIPTTYTITNLRDMLNPDFPAHPALQIVAYLARREYMTNASHTDVLVEGGWHLPLITNTAEGDVEADALIEQGHTVSDLVKIATGRCARVSYLTHTGQRDPAKDMTLHDQLLTDRHLSPFEHCAQALGKDDRDTWSGNFRGFRQYRKEIPQEDVWFNDGDGGDEVWDSWLKVAVTTS